MVFSYSSLRHPYKFEFQILKKWNKISVYKLLGVCLNFEFNCVFYLLHLATQIVKYSPFYNT